MTTHELKCDIPHFELLFSGKKTAEFRFNDRNYQNGDELVIREYDRCNKRYTERGVHRRITDVTILDEWAPGYVLISFIRKRVK